MLDAGRLRGVDEGIAVVAEVVGKTWMVPLPKHCDDRR